MPAAARPHHLHASVRRFARNFNPRWDQAKGQRRRQVLVGILPELLGAAAAQLSPSTFHSLLTFPPSPSTAHRFWTSQQWRYPLPSRRLRPTSETASPPRSSPPHPRRTPSPPTRRSPTALLVCARAPTSSTAHASASASSVHSAARSSRARPSASWSPQATTRSTTTASRWSIRAERCSSPAGNPSAPRSPMRRTTTSSSPRSTSSSRTLRSTSPPRPRWWSATTRVRRASSSSRPS